MPDEQTYTSKRAADLSGLSPHMVNYLCREGLLEPSGRSARGRGRWRAYTFGDVVMLRALARFLRAGVSVANLKRSLAAIRKYHPEITPKALPSRFIVTDGQHIFFRERGDVVEALSQRGQFVFAFVLELQQVRNEVLKKVGGIR